MDVVTHLNNVDISSCDNLYEAASKYLNEIKKLPEKDIETLCWKEIMDKLHAFSSVRTTDKNYEYNIFLPNGSEKMMNLDVFEDCMKDIEKAYNNTFPLIRRKCIDCGDEFYLYQSEVQFFIDNDLHVPKRCRNCRNTRKVESLL